MILTTRSNCRELSLGFPSTYKHSSCDGDLHTCALKTRSWVTYIAFVDMLFMLCFDEVLLPTDETIRSVLSSFYSTSHPIAGMRNYQILDVLNNSAGWDTDKISRSIILQLCSCR
jgi:uncharacterized protein YceK